MLGLVFRWSALLVKELLVGLGDMGLGTSSFLRASYAAAAPTATRAAGARTSSFLRASYAAAAPTATRAAGASTTPPAIFPALLVLRNIILLESVVCSCSTNSNESGRSKYYSAGDLSCCLCKASELACYRFLIS
ncbi:hypothetical protein PRIPAC_80919 [Pristionchus pacificus]|uniref:Uncharacterized protein n=1 Tax=Pristionchus pacificus TaxID=54126 RepID=A0A2A6CB78_PRIPA|nr:hypothetical protein PRIPAC_80919 [Pristionchus pacificus]|eukprot:PDM75303.1 hypothetical protein PRIPAC_43497 [Pristionchus pacificus]